MSKDKHPLPMEYRKDLWSDALTVTADVGVWFTILGNLVLSLKHPKNTGASTLVVRTFGRELVEYLKGQGVKLVPEIEDEFLLAFYSRKG